MHQQIETRQGRSAGTRAHQLHLLDGLADHPQSIHHRCADDDGGAMLIIMEHRDFHALAQLALDVETLRRLDVLEIDTTERGLERGDDVHQFVRVALIEFDVKAIDTGKLLEQHRLAFHHRLGGERTDRTQTEHRRAIGHNTDEVATRSELGCLGRIAHDLLAGGRNTGRIGQRQIALVDQSLGGRYGDFSRLGKPMVVERGSSDVLVHDAFR